MKKNIIVVTGPTASGKSAIAMCLAERLSGHIVCMDSMQIYRRMDIGTAKPTADEQRRVPHSMLDIADPDENYSAARYRQECFPLLQGLDSPILTGGTGLYLNAVSKNMAFGESESDNAVRQKYQALCCEIGNEALWKKLSEVDPDAAGKLHFNDTRRVIRALEVYELTGIPFSKQKPMEDTSDIPFSFHVYAPYTERSLLYSKIDHRVDQMMKSGLYEEVESLYRSGIPENAQSMQGIGYKELYSCIKGEMSLARSVDLIKQRTRNYAKRQMTWFRRDERVSFLSTEEKTPEQLAELIIEDITKKSEE